MIESAAISAVSLIVGFFLGEASRVLSRRAERADREAAIDAQLLLDIQDALGAMSRATLAFRTQRVLLGNSATDLRTSEEAFDRHRAAAQEVLALQSRVIDGRPRASVVAAATAAAAVEHFSVDDEKMREKLNEATTAMGATIADALTELGDEYRALREPRSNLFSRWRARRARD
jgi:hypothetical protein